MAMRICVSFFFACAHLALGADTTTTTTAPIIKYYNDLVKNLPMQHGKCVAITGTTSGLGYWSAVAAARKGAACVIMLNRKSSRAVKAEENVKKEALPGVDVITVISDLQNLSSVREAAAQVNKIVTKYGGLDVLALNAGVMALRDERTPDGFDVQMQTNQLSHFLLTKLLMPALRKAGAARGEARIITQSSLARMAATPNRSYYVKSLPNTLGGGAIGSPAAFERYHQTKLANIAFSMRLHSKLVDAKYSAFKSLSVAPGIAATELVKGGITLPKWMLDLLTKYLVLSAPDGSCSLLVAMFDPSAKSGDFYEPKFLVEGPPLKVIDQGVPSTLAEMPRHLVGVRDKEICTTEVGDKVWHDTEAGLGEKFIIEEESPLVV